MSAIQFSVSHQFASSRSLLTPLPPESGDQVDENITQTKPPPSLKEALPADLDSPVSGSSSPDQVLPGTTLDARLRELKLLLEEMYQKQLSLAGEKIAGFSARDSDQMQGVTPNKAGAPERDALSMTVTGVAQERAQNLSLIKVRMQESEQLSYAIRGQVVLSDNRVIDVDFVESRQRELDITLEVGAEEARRLIDPLVINLNGPLQMNDQRVLFDLNSDGDQEGIAELGEGSYYLAVDLDNNGIIDDGAELFGAQSGNGFAELQQYDLDNNGLIDQGDPVFEQLQLFRPDNEMTSLSERGVIAIGLAHTATPYNLTNRQGELLAHLRASGFYLTDDGFAGSVQQIDHTV